jgi:hypothetical protein
MAWLQVDHWWGQVLVTVGAVLMLVGTAGIIFSRRGEPVDGAELPNSEGAVSASRRESEENAPR